MLTTLDRSLPLPSPLPGMARRPGPQTQMRYHTLRDLPKPVSRLALGWHTTQAEPGDGAQAVVETALDAGVNLLATSPTYGAGASEFSLGRILRQIDATPMVATRVHLHPASFAKME